MGVRDIKMGGLMGAVPNALPNDLNGIGVLIGLACSGRLIPPELVVSMMMQRCPTHFSEGYLLVKGKPVEEARNLLAQKALEMNAKYLFFIDDDTIAPPNSLQRLIYVLDNAPDIAAIGGVYCTKADVPAPVVFRGMGKGSFWNWKKGDIFEVTGIGAGCLLIRTEIFHKLTYPWFKFDTELSYDHGKPSSSVSEDIYFCNAVRAAGYKVFAHGGILCDHYDPKTNKMVRMPEDSYPMREGNANLLQCSYMEQATKENK
jgi:hypothetical protein